MDDETGSAPLSESIEMYLLRIALLQQNRQPVPAPLLAQELGISLVSVNEMIRKLMDKGLVAYEPYKGITLTARGAQLARRVLRCRRLWEVFFFEELGIEPHQAETLACRFEHITPDDLAERLATYLESPPFSPQHEPIPYDNPEVKEVLRAALGRPDSQPTVLLNQLKPGQVGTIVRVGGRAAARRRLLEMGLVRGETIAVERIAPLGDPVEFMVKGYHLSLRRQEAAQIEVELKGEA